MAAVRRKYCIALPLSAVRVARQKHRLRIALLAFSKLHCTRDHPAYCYYVCLWTATLVKLHSSNYLLHTHKTYTQLDQPCTSAAQCLDSNQVASRKPFESCINNCEVCAEQAFIACRKHCKPLTATLVTDFDALTAQHLCSQQLSPQSLFLAFAAASNSL